MGLRVSDVAAVAQEVTGAVIASVVRRPGANDHTMYDVETSTVDLRPASRRGGRTHT